MSTEIVPREKVSKQGVQGDVTTAGGIVTFIVAAITTGVGGIHWLGAILGVVVGVAGLALSSSRHDRTLGVVTTVVGAGMAVASFGLLRGLIHGVLIGGGIVLVGIGVYSLYRFFRGLKSRS